MFAEMAEQTVERAVVRDHSFLEVIVYFHFVGDGIEGNRPYACRVFCVTQYTKKTGARTLLGSLDQVRESPAEGVCDV